MLDLILQNESSFEVRAVINAAMMMNEPPRLIRCGILGLDEHRELLRSGKAMPIGSVEFVRAAMQASGIAEPAGLSYPDELKPFLHRSLRRVRAGNVLGHWFVKPVRTKAFTGFVFDTMQNPASLSDHDREQHDAFMAMDADEPVWISEPIQFVSEWRFYICNRAIIGQARYDSDGADDAPSPDLASVKEAISRLPFDHPCALDMGVTSDGQTALVEVNDAWAIGLYGEAMTTTDYLRFLEARWISILATSKEDTTPAERPAW